MRKLILFIPVFLTHFAFGQYSGTPLMLSLPMDQDTIEEDEPVFVWQTTLSNVQNDPRLNVQLSVVKMETDQTQTEAMVENAPVFIRQNLLSNSLNYSSIDHELEEGVWYAWQVVMFYNGVQVQQSEVWKFINTAIVDNSMYQVLRTTEDGSILQIDNKKLYFTTREHGKFDLSAEISGNGIKTKYVILTEVFPGKDDEGIDMSGNENRYFTCDLSDVKLKKGIYKFSWIANENTHFVHYIQK